MTPQGEPPISESLRDDLGTPNTVRRLASSPRSRVWLVEFDGAPAIVKQVVDGTDAPARYAREVTALGLAARVDPPVVPAILGTDPRIGVMVLEYLPSQAPAADWMIDYAEALARLHASTTAHDTGLLPPQSAPGPADVTAFLDLARRLHVTLPPRAHDQLDALCDRLATSTGHALLHGDPCPGNDLHTGDGMRFVDLEQAALGDGITELAYLRIGFPTCWCVTNPAPQLLADAEHAYHRQWRADTGSTPSGELADACTGWLIRGDALVERADRGSIDQLARVARHDWTWGTTTARGRLAHRTAVVAAIADGDSRLGDVGQLCQDLHDSMMKHWPELAKNPLPVIRGHMS